MANQGQNLNTAFKQTQTFYRLFMVPGLLHCTFGPGPNSFGNLFSGQVVAPPPPVEDAEHDAFIALQRWVEHGVALDRIVATKYIDDQPTLGIQMTRPICAFPKVLRGFFRVVPEAGYLASVAPTGWRAVVIRP